MNDITQPRNDLPIPSMDLVLNGKLDPARVPDSGAPVVMAVPASHAGQTLTLILAHATGGELFTQELPIGSSGRPITLRIPKQYFSDNTGKALKVLYRVSSVGDSPSLPFEVEQGFTGPLKLDLKDHRYIPVYVNGERRLPVQLPAFLRFTRSAPGATGYSSSDDSVAQVDGQGQVTVLRNGQTKITAQLPGGPQSYELTVEGIRGLEFLAAQGTTWQAAGKLCQDLDLQLPGQADFATLQSLYGAGMASLGLPNLAIWGALVGQDTAWTFHPYTQELTSESTDANTLRQVAGIG